MKQSMVLLLAFGLFYLGGGQDKTTRQEVGSAVIGLNIGEQSPAFTFRDQFGRAGSSAALRGTSGIVLLFFRSADW